MKFNDLFFDSTLGQIFGLLALYYAYKGVRLVAAAWRNRDSFAQGVLTLAKKQWAEQASFYVAIPPGVVVHELGHALAVWLFGGAVVGYGYIFYAGYIVPAGSFSAAQNWFISIAGTIGTLLYGLFIWLWLRHTKSSVWRYFGLQALRIHIYYALVYYPLFTLFTFIGDWRTIYNFGETPLLSGATLFFHLLALGLFWWSDRQGWYEQPAFQSAAEREALATLRARADEHPGDEQLQLQVINTLFRNNASREGQERLKAFLKENPRSARGHLLQALVEAQGRQQLPAGARRHAEQALSLGLAQPANAAQAHLLLGQYYLGVEKLGEALRQLEDARGQIERSTTMPDGEQRHQLLAQIHYWRAVAYRRQRQYRPAGEAIERAIEHSRSAGKIPAQYENERANIRRQAGEIR